MKQKKIYSKVFVPVLSLSLLSNLFISTTAQANESTETKQEVVVVYKNNTGKERVLEDSIKVDHEFKTVPAVSATLTTNNIHELKNDPNIAYVEPNVTFTITGKEDVKAMVKTADSIPFEESLWNFQTVDPYAKSFKQGITGKGVKVAVIDTGIYPHPDLSIEGGTSTVDYTPSYTDDNGHGTHVAGIIGAKHNGVGIVGIAPDVHLFAVKSLDGTGRGNLDDVLKGIDWSITNHMDIINLSLATTFNSQALHDMVDKANKEGILLVAAAGNDGEAVNYPAKFDSVIAVSAIDENKNIASFSSRGPEVEFTAPGDNIISTYLDGYYGKFNGTSQASPHVAAMLALLKEKNPNMSNYELRTELQKYVEDLGVKGRDPLYGYGLVNFSAFQDQDSKTNSQIFSDVPTTHWAYPAIMDLVNKKIVSGYGNSRFGMGDPVTREQVAALIYRALEISPKGEYPNPYRDLNENSTMFLNEVLALTEMNVFNGDEHENFRPKDSLTREEMAQVLTNAFKLKNKGQQNFNDVNPNSWANEAISALQSNGISAGTGEGKFEPKMIVTREQFAQFLYKAMNL